eukprot:6050204-Alexandrium_andersonii.AAC.1
MAGHGHGHRHAAFSAGLRGRRLSMSAAVGAPRAGKSSARGERRAHRQRRNAASGLQVERGRGAE